MIHEDTQEQETLQSELSRTQLTDREQLNFNEEDIEGENNIDAI